MLSLNSLFEVAQFPGALHGDAVSRNTSYNCRPTRLGSLLSAHVPCEDGISPSLEACLGERSAKNASFSTLSLLGAYPQLELGEIYLNAREHLVLKHFLAWFY